MAMTAWKGGDIPVSRYADVKVRLRGGSTCTGHAGGFSWDHSPSGLAEADIVAYEVLGAAPVEVPPPGAPWVPYDGSGMPPFVGNPMVRVRTHGGVARDPLPANAWNWGHFGERGDIVAYQVYESPPLDEAGLGDSHQALTFGAFGIGTPTQSNPSGYAATPHPGLAFTGSLAPAQLTPPASTSPLPVDAKARKALPVFSGFVRYFPDAMVEVAELSRVGNDQHNPGKPLFWDRSKSGDELDALTRHLIDAGTFDNDGVRHSTKVAWRAMANLQKEIERSRKGAS